MSMKRKCLWFLLAGQLWIGSMLSAQNRLTEVFVPDTAVEASGLQDPQLLERLRNMPNIEVGKGITFEPQNKLYKMTMRFRMQNLLALSFDDDFSLTETQAQVKRLRLRFDGYIFSPKLLYSIQLGFTSYDTKVLPNGNNNFVRDAMVYYMPSSTWNIGFGQTKI